MGTILRSSKFVRYFAGIARSIVFNTSRGELDETFVQRSQCITSNLRSLATQIIPSHATNDSDLDRSLRRLDQDVRRTGRISRRELEDILEELRQARSATSTQSLLIIRCCGSLVPEESPEVRTQLVEEIWKTLENIGVPMDISHYNALLRVYLENEHAFSPSEFLANLEHKGIEPNRVTYQRLIARYCQHGDIEGATRILEFMREKQLPVNESVFNALILGHSQAGDLESAVGILGVMQQAGLEPSADTYTTLLCAYAKKGDMDTIESTLQECEKNDIQLLDKDYMDIIYTLAVNNHHEHVYKIIVKMRQTAGYNQDAVSLILRLINKGYEELAYSILLTMPYAARNGEQAFVGTFFIRQLVKAKRPIEKIKSLCEKLEKEGLNPRAFYFATECSLQTGNIDQACGLLAVMKEKDLPIRQHYFWPLLARHPDCTLDIITRMSTQFNIAAGYETLREYIIPALEKMPVNDLINSLRSAGVSVGAAASAIVAYFLSQNEIAKAADIAMRYRAYYSAPLLKRPLVQAFLRTEDTDSFVNIIRQIHDNIDRASIADEDLLASVPDPLEAVGQFVLDVAAVSKKNRAGRIEAILKGLLDQGLSMSNSGAERLQERLGEELSSEISTLLGKLTSGELVPVTLSRPAAPPGSTSPMDEAQLLRLQESLQKKGEPTRGIKRQLLTLYCRNRDLEKAKQIVKELEADNFVFSGGMYAQLLDLYAHHEKIEEVLNLNKTLKEKEPDFALDDIKIIKVASLLVKNNQIADAVRFLSEQSRERKLQERSFPYGAMCWRMLNSLAETGQVDELKQLFDALVKYEYIDVNNVLLGPLIKVHVVRNDLQGAMEQFEWCCQKYRTTPWKNELACRMIQAEDAVSLQKLTDLSTQVHGEVNSLYDLVFAFVECGRVRQARKILETPGLRSRPQRLNSACERYQQEGLVKPLEGLVEATRDISHIDRADIYYHLLLSYCKSKDPDKALGLWTRMQEEDVQPSEEFLVKLGNFLKLEGLEVPFVIPKLPAASSKDENKKIPQKVSQENASASKTVNQFRAALRQDDLDTALKIIEKVENSDEKLSVADLSHLVESLVKAERQCEATKVLQGILEKGLRPIPRISRFLLNHLASAGDIDSIIAIGNHLSFDMKKMVSYDNRLCHAYVTAGKASEYLKILTQEIDEVKESDLEKLEEKFPRGGAIGILQNHPELQPEYEQLAAKYAENGVKGPINVLWMHLFIKREQDAANRLWDKYLAGAPRVMFQHILQTSRSNQDESLSQKLVALLKHTSVSEGARGNVYSCIIDILVAKQKYDEALKAVQEAVDDVCLENLNRTALLRLKTGLASQGKPFPYEIPAKNARPLGVGTMQSSTVHPNTNQPGPSGLHLQDAKSSTSSSSSSDDEPPRPQRQ